MGPFKKIALFVLMSAMGIAYAQEDTPSKAEEKAQVRRQPPKRVQPTYSIEEERSYTVSRFTLPYTCKEENYKGICNFFVNYFVSKFDHDYISFVTSHLDLEDPDEDQLSNRETAYQDVNLDIRVIKKVGFMYVEADIDQEYMGEKASQKELFNFHLATRKIVKFRDLFDDPELAAMLCANLIEDKYLDSSNTKNLAIVRAQIEIEPSNFLILPDGIEFIFNEGVVSPKKEDSSVFISTDDLKAAKPKEQWFPLLKKDS